eukprot:CAMPEP_0119381064 /NCGR_PEP_ID=MMETSP1334-20130426/60342_1 /TAXON_ID=127549 /ORGANISM="Calcidiscus leptoporus, Strain RCC1130" /LENGTH=38 /DNA_ID= /DNA_START= /DNA_END= /DNA_ORIENTATION=
MAASSARRTTGCGTGCVVLYAMTLRRRKRASPALMAAA